MKIVKLLPESLHIFVSVHLKFVSVYKLYKQWTVYLFACHVYVVLSVMDVTNMFPFSYVVLKFVPVINSVLHSVYLPSSFSE